MNDHDRTQWVQNDEGLYKACRRSGKSLTTFVRENRPLIDEVIRNVTEGKKPAHYLAYGAHTSW